MIGNITVVNVDGSGSTTLPNRPAGPLRHVAAARRHGDPVPRRAPQGQRPGAWDLRHPRRREEPAARAHGQAPEQQLRLSVVDRRARRLTGQLLPLLFGRDAVGPYPRPRDRRGNESSRARSAPASAGARRFRPTASLVAFSRIYADGSSSWLSPRRMGAAKAPSSVRGSPGSMEGSSSSFTPDGSAVVSMVRAGRRAGHLPLPDRRLAWDRPRRGRQLQLHRHPAARALRPI